MEGKLQTLHKGICVLNKAEYTTEENYLIRKAGTPQKDKDILQQRDTYKVVRR